MSMPVIPSRTQPEAFTDLLESIALEETALSHLINAEGEKVQASAAAMNAGTMTADQVIEFQQGVARVIQTAIKLQMLLQFKLENTLDAKTELEGTTPQPANTVTPQTVTPQPVNNVQQ